MSMTAFAPSGTTPRVLAVQTAATKLSEAVVLHPLLEAAGANARPQLEILLAQGITRDKPHERGDSVARWFAGVPGVRVEQLRTGDLGLYGMTVLQRARKVSDLRRLRRERSRLERVAEAFQPEVLYTSQRIWDVSLTRRVAERQRRPLVIHLHVTCSKWLGKGVEDALRRATMVIAVSDFVRSDAVKYGIPASRVRTLHNCVPVPPPLSDAASALVRQEVRQELGIAPDALVVLMAARLAPIKGQEDLLAALVPHMQLDPRVHLVLAGAEYPGPNGMSQRMIASARREGVAAQLHLCGFRRDVPRLLDACDVFAHPSRDEPFCLAILEAMAHGRPVVALDQGGPAEIVIDGVTGLLVEPDDAGSLRRSFDGLLSSPQLRSEMGEKGRARAETAFSVETGAALFVDLLREAARSVA